MKTAFNSDADLKITFIKTIQENIEKEIVFINPNTKDVNVNGIPVDPATERTLGFPKEMLEFRNDIYVAMLHKDSKNTANHFLLQFYESANVKAILGDVLKQFVVWQITDPVWGVAQYMRNKRNSEFAEKVVEIFSAKLPLRIDLVTLIHSISESYMEAINSLGNKSIDEIFALQALKCATESLLENRSGVRTTHSSAFLAICSAQPKASKDSLSYSFRHAEAEKLIEFITTAPLENN